MDVMYEHNHDLEKGPVVGVTGIDVQCPCCDNVRKPSKMLECFLDFASELAGTFTMLWFGLGANAQVLLSNNTAGGYLSINIAWGLGVMFGILVGQRSGAHMNPAVSITNVFLRGFPISKVPVYLIGQLMGAMLAALVVYANYIVPIRAFNATAGDHTVGLGNSTVSIFSTYPQNFMTLEGRFFSEFVTSAMLMAGIYAIDYTYKKGGSKVFAPIGVAALIVALGMSSGWETAYALNPARDFGPRLVMYMLGYGTEVFTVFNYYFWIPIAAPIVGCFFGGFMYDFVSGNPESPVRHMLDWMSGDRMKSDDKIMMHHGANSSTGSIDTIVACPH